MVDLIKFKVMTQSTRMWCNRKVVSFLSADCGVWADENDRRAAIKNYRLQVSNEKLDGGIVGRGLSYEERNARISLFTYL